MHAAPRTQPIRQVVFHVNVGPEVEGGARGLAGYLASNGPDGGGYHAIADDHELVVLAFDDVEVWGNGGINPTSLDVCIIGGADQSPAQWADPYSTAAIHNAAVWAAGKCAAYRLPIRRLAPAELPQGHAGVCGHCDVSAAGYRNSAGHYDPGPWFPWTACLDTMTAVLAPPPPNTLATFLTSLKAAQVSYGDHGPKVVKVQRALVRHGLHVLITGRYDPATAHAVAVFKADNGLKSRDPNHVGTAMLLALAKKPKRKLQAAKG